MSVSNLGMFRWWFCLVLVSCWGTVAMLNSSAAAEKIIVGIADLESASKDSTQGQGQNGELPKEPIKEEPVKEKSTSGESLNQSSIGTDVGQWSLGLATNYVAEPRLNGVERSSTSLPSLEVGYSVVPRWKWVTEYLHRSSKEGSGVFSVSESRHDLNFWYLFTGHRNKRWDWWVGSGWGWSYQTVTNRFFDEELKASSANIFRLGARLDGVLWITSQIFVDLNFRFYFWNVNPDRTRQMGILLGYYF